MTYKELNKKIKEAKAEYETARDTWRKSKEVRDNIVSEHEMNKRFKNEKLYQFRNLHKQLKIFDITKNI